jgi:glycerate dehydrogenase
MGIVGYGALGKEVAKLAQAFGMEVLVAERKGAATSRPGRVPFERVIRESTVVVVLCPLTEESRGMIGARELSQMPSHAIVINCGRGGIVDEKALAEALESGRIAGAGLDVLSEEPPKSGNPLLELDRCNLIVTPHVAWASVQSMQALADQVMDNVEAFLAGKPQNVVE